MKRIHLLACAAIAATWTAAAAAQEREQDFHAGTFALSAERLTGFYHVADTQSPDGGGAEVTTKTDDIAFLGKTGHSAYDLPRIGFDGFVIDHLSVGGSLAVMHASTEVKGTANGIGATVTTTTTQTTVLFAPRVGYAMMFTDVVGIWPRGGFSYASTTTDTDGGGDRTQKAFALDIDVPLLIAPTPSFAITVGPTIDVTMGGSYEVHQGNFTFKGDESIFCLGLAAGLTGFF